MSTQDFHPALLPKIVAQDILPRYSWLGGIEERAAGGEMLPCLAKEVRALKNVKLDEGPGEGYHRGTHLTKMRAASTKTAWLLAANRHKQNLQKGVEMHSEGTHG